jgi:hypothetical protein
MRIVLVTPAQQWMQHPRQLLQFLNEVKHPGRPAFPQSSPPRAILSIPATSRQGFTSCRHKKTTAAQQSDLQQLSPLNAHLQASYNLPDA